MQVPLRLLLLRTLGWWIRAMLVLGSILTAGAVCAQQLPDQLRFGRAAGRDGLPNDAVLCLLLDHAGFLWVGTEDGLARYDGLSFTVFRHRRGDATSLPHNTVLTIAEDPAGRLWVGTHGGVGCLDAARETFRTWHPRAGDSTALPTDYDCRVLVSRAGTVWLGGPAGLSQYDPVRNQWRRVRLPADGGVVSALHEDRLGQLWLGTIGRVRVLNPRTRRLVASLVVVPRPGEATPPLTGFSEDGTGAVLATTWGAGVVTLDLALARAVPHGWDAPVAEKGITNISHAAAETAPPGGPATRWLGTTRGLLRLDETHPAAPLPADLRAARVYSELGDVSALLADPATGRLWIGTATGLAWLEPRQQLFTTVALAAGEHLIPQQLQPDRDPRTHRLRYWLASWYGSGLARYDSAFRFEQAWPRLPVGSADPDARQVSDVLRSRVDGALWAATFAGLVRLDPETGSSRVFRVEAADTASLPDSRCIGLLEDHAGRLWVGTYGGGLACLETAADRPAGRFRRVRGLPNDNITALTEDAAGRVWIGTNGGGLVCAAAGPTGRLRVYRPDAARPRGLPDGNINALWPAPDGRLWVATRDGLAIWQPPTDDFQLLNSGHGLPSDNIYGLLPDRTGHLWLTTQRGLVRLVLPRPGERPTARAARTFDVTNGLPQTDLHGLFAPLPDGRLVIGGNGALVLVDPTALRPSRRPPTVRLTEVRVLGEHLRTARPLDSLRLTLRPDQNSLSIGFAALDFADPRGNHCEYRLDAGTEAREATAAGRPWVAAGTDRRATFAHLSGGEYTFRVRARNVDGVPSAHDATLRFTIQTPWWRTGWFRSLLLALGGLGLALYVRRIRRRGEQRAHLAREMAELELRALRAQLNPHFIFNALNAVQELVLTGRPTDAGRYLARFARLLRLVLDGADRPTVPLDTELEVLRLYADIEQLRLEGLEVVFDIDPDLLAAAPAVPPMILQPYLENAFWHGVAARPAGERRVVVRLTFGEEETTIHAQIDDTGIGRAAAATRRPATAGRAPHTSQGQRLTERRLALLGLADPIRAGSLPVHITDLLNPTTGAALGTRVEIWLPVR